MISERLFAAIAEEVSNKYADIEQNDINITAHPSGDVTFSIRRLGQMAMRTVTARQLNVVPNLADFVRSVYNGLAADMGLREVNRNFAWDNYRPTITASQVRAAFARMATPQFTIDEFAFSPFMEKIYEENASMKALKDKSDIEAFKDFARYGSRLKGYDAKGN